MSLSMPFIKLIEGGVCIRFAYSNIFLSFLRTRMPKTPNIKPINPPITAPLTFPSLFFSSGNIGLSIT